MTRKIYSRFSSRRLAEMGLEYFRAVGEFADYERPRIIRIENVWCITIYASQY